MDLQIVGVRVCGVLGLEIDCNRIVEIICQVCESPNNFNHVVPCEVAFVVSPPAKVDVALRIGAHHIDRLWSLDSHGGGRG